jgi:hypothetical protein
MPHRHRIRDQRADQVYLAGMKGLFVLAGFLVLASCRTMRPDDVQAEERRWANLLYQSERTTPQTGDTAFVMVSNRKFLPGQTRFATEQRNSDTLRYFVLKKQPNGPWTVTQVPDLYTAIRALPPQRDWLLYTEGMGKRFTDNVERGYLMSSTYGLNVILYDYPSRRSDLGLMKNFRFSLAEARASGDGWVRVLQETDNLRRSGAMGDKQLTLFFHSMGNLSVREAALQKRIPAFTRPPADHVILNAPCVPARHHAEWLSDLNLGRQTFVHVNRGDYKLRGASLLSGNRKLGNKPGKEVAPGVHYIDFHASQGRTHNYFLWIPGRDNPLHPPVKTYFAHVLQGLTPPDSCFSTATNKMGAKIIATLPAGKTP